MGLTGAHLLLSYKCNAECDHCFVWGSPFLEGTMTLGGIGAILFLFTAIAFEMAIIFLGGAPVFRVMKSWLRKGVMPVDDVLTLLVWILVSIVISLFLAFFFVRKGITKLETSSS